MVLAFAIPLGVLFGLVLGGRLGALADLRLRGIGLLYGAIALQVVAFPSGVFPWSTPDAVAIALWLLSYGLLAAATVLNRRVPGALVIGAGMLCNVAAVVTNGGHMPAADGALRGAGVVIDGVRNNSAALADPALPWLIDRWAAPHWLPLANVYSVGDVVIAAGTAALVCVAMRPRRLRRVGAARA